MSTSPRAVIIDREAERRAQLTRELRLAAPTIEVDGLETPGQSDSPPEFVVIHVGDEAAINSMATVRFRWPTTRMIVLSAGPDPASVRFPDDSCFAHIHVPEEGEYGWAVGAVASIIDGMSDHSLRSKAGIYETITAIGDLIREWNTRLNREAA